nr:PREDICTED: uncharacterized protein LOC107078082 [Lepisosteus oculatus]
MNKSRLLQRDTSKLCGSSVEDCRNAEKRDTNADIRANIVGSTKKCISARDLCNGPLRPETGYRTRYVLVDDTGKAVMSSNWSDTFKTKPEPIPYQTIQPWDSVHSAGMIVLVVILAVLFFLLLLLCLFCLVCCRKKPRKVYKQAKAYDTHYTKDMLHNSLATGQVVRVHREVQQENAPYFIQSREEYQMSSQTSPQLHRHNSFYAFLENIRNRVTLEVNSSTHRQPDQRILEAISRSSTLGIQTSKPRSRSASDFLESAKRSSTLARQQGSSVAGSTQTTVVSSTVSHNSSSQESYSILHRQVISSSVSDHSESEAVPV